MSDRKVRVRFAPSPTGFLHIGGARTALFNWVFARQNKGDFLLRVEDTDEKRSLPEYLDSIKDGLLWLGLSWDEEPVFQSQRKQRHKEVADTLLENGRAYFCQCPPTMEQGDEVVVCSCSTQDYQEGALRLKRLRPEEALEINDIVYGTVRVESEQLDDMVLLRSNGNPTYLLSSFVDDYDMGITHIIRGVDHLTNTVRQHQIAACLGWSFPACAHLPLIHGQDGKKLSKRHGAVDLREYQSMGFLPSALRNALIRIGWGYQDREIMNDDEILELFSLDRVGKAKGQFAQDKLEHYNQSHMISMDREKLWEFVVPFMQKSCDDEQKKAALILIPEILKRSKYLKDVAKALDVLWPPQEYEREIESNEHNMLKDVLEACTVWSPEELEKTFRQYVAEHQCKLVHLAQPLRIILTGKSVSPPVFLIMSVLGKEEVIQRIKNVASK